ncbi:hypothetical protein [Paenibacillus sp. WC2504]|uniref:hypothetical protein n=1 Tax=Paenibacillus sp. WC2504 TaxID=3461403 RepID=UPI004045546A
MSSAGSQHTVRQPSTSSPTNKSMDAATTSDQASYDTTSIASLSQMMLLQRTIGNQAVANMVQRRITPQTAQGTVIQRSLDDETKVTWTHIKLSALWTKMRDRSEGKDGMPNYGGNIRDAMADYVNTVHTERELAEIIVNREPFKAIFLNPRKNQQDDAIADPGGNIDQAIQAVLAACIFYHATFEENVADILAGGIKASKGGKGSGISTHGRDNAAANATYNKWSKGHSFITKSRAEANGYKEKMALKKPAKIIHILSLPAFIDDSSMKVDIDSKAGLKYEGDLDMIGDGAKLNDRALKVIHMGLKQMNRTALDAKILEVYTANYG